MHLVTKWFGTFLCDKKGVQKKILFPKDDKEIYKRLLKIEKNEILAEERKIIKKIEVTVSEKRLQKIGEYKPSDSFFNGFKIKSDDFGFSDEMLHKVSLMLAKNRVDEKLASEDLQVIQMVNALDDLIQTSNLLSERLDSWLEISNSKKKSQSFKNVFSVVNDEIKTLENQIQVDMNNIAPNLSEIAGSLTGARLLSYAGGLKKIAMLPASTIQILGAEKALFRFKKEGGKPPKHGVIFQNSLINKAPRNDRGKIARVMANTIAIAAKADAFTKRDISAELKKDMEKKIKKCR